MNRKFLFRVFDVANKTMLYQDIEEFIEISNNQLIVYPRSILMQFTGLYDCRAEKIFEGDIVEDYTGHRYLIEFSDGEFYGVNNYKRCNKIGNESLEVMGNKYENLELLEGWL